MVNYELLNHVLILARAIEVISLVAAFAFLGYVLQRVVEEVAQFFRLRKKRLDKSNNK